MGAGTVTIETQADSGADTFRVTRPGSGEVLAELPIQGAEEVRSAVDAAREAQGEWVSRSVKDRARVMLRLAEVFEAHADRVVAQIVAETGKPRTEALAAVVVTVDLIRFFAGVAPTALARKRVGTGWMLWKSSWVEHEPHGVIGAITPWNYPLLLGMDTVSAALFAGNAIVVKPSEFTPLTTLLVPELCREAGLPEGLVGVVLGDGTSGEALVRGGVDKVLFTGSSETGRRVMRAAADRLTPVGLELGGKDPAIVLADADLERAARGVVFGALFNAGQTCISVERAFVERPIAAAFTDRVVRLVGELRHGEQDDVDVGPMITSSQLDVVERHVGDAMAKGARALTGGKRDPESASYPPTVLVDVDETMEVLRDETFGPVLPIVVVDSAEEAIGRANASGYGLCASVWTRDRARGRQIARRLRAGGVSINDVLSHYGVGGLPMGGVGDSGFGRRRGVEGLLEMTRTKSVFMDRLGLRREPWWFPYSARTYGLSRAVLAWRARGGVTGALRAVRHLFVGGGRDV